jgi:cell division transport system permease protein
MAPAPAGAQAHSAQPGPAAQLRAWLTHHLRVLLASMGRMARAPVSSALTVSVIAIALALPAALFAALSQFQDAARHWEGAAHISLFLKSELSAAAVKDLAQRLKADTRITLIEIVPPEAALREFRAVPGFAVALDALEGNPFPHVLNLQLAAPQQAPADIEALVEELRRRPEVEQVQYDQQWLLRLAAFVALVERAAAVIAGLLSLAVLLVIGNTIRLAIHSRREEILVMKMVGGTDAFIRRGFLYEGLWFGLLGGAAAWLLVLGAAWLITGPAQHLAAAYGASFSFSVSWTLLAGALATSGGLLGLLGASLAVSRHLKDIEPG